MVHVDLSKIEFHRIQYFTKPENVIAARVGGKTGTNIEGLRRERNGFKQYYSEYAKQHKNFRQ